MAFFLKDRTLGIFEQLHSVFGVFANNFLSTRTVLNSESSYILKLTTYFFSDHFFISDHAILISFTAVDMNSKMELIY